MTRLAVFLAALVLVPAASAAFPAPYAVQGPSVVLRNGTVQFTALKDGTNTRVVAAGADGATLRSDVVPGAFGIPGVTQSGLAGGLFHDGSAFVLQQVGLAKTSHFAIVSHGRPLRPAPDRPEGDVRLRRRSRRTARCST